MHYDYTVEVTNRFKRLDLIDTVPEELWTEVHNIVQEAVIKTTSKKKKCEYAKQLSEEVLQIAEKRRQAKGKGERQRYTHLNEEFQEQQEEIRKPSSGINAKKQRKTIEWENIMASSPITSWQTDGEKMETVTDFIFFGSHCKQ